MNAIESGAAPLLTLVPLAMLVGLAIIAVYRRFTNEAALRRGGNRMIALAMEFRLFIDEPALVFRTQRELLVENLRLLKLIAPATLIVSVVLVALYPQLDAWYGRAPLPLNEAAVITARFDAMPPSAPVLRTGSNALRIETDGVRALSTREVSWRIRPVNPAAVDLEVATAAGRVNKHVIAGGGLHYIAPLRASSWIAAVMHPFERPVSMRGFDEIAVAYPRREILGFDWTVWFFGISSLAAILALPFIRLAK